MGKDQMIKETGIEQIKYFPDFTESEKKIVEKSFLTMKTPLDISKL